FHVTGVQTCALPISPWYLVRYYRLLKFRLANPHVILRGMVFLGKRVEVHATPGLGRLEIGRWVHIGDGNAIRCHEGSLRIGDKEIGRASCRERVESW